MNHGANGSCYANVDLPENGTAKTLAFTFENGAVQATREISWAVTNLATADSLTIRKGDALRLTAFEGEQAGSQTVAIYLDGTSLGDRPAGSPLVRRFDTAGTHLLRAVYSSATGTPVERTVSVKVIGGEFAGSPVGLANQWRTWINPALPPGLDLEFDHQVNLAAPVAENGGTTLQFLTENTDTHYGVARIAPGGPILAGAVIRGEAVYSANQTSMQVVETYPDGTRVVEMKIVVSNLQPDTEVHVDIFVGGVVFRDTGATTRVLKAENFDAMGVATVYFVQAPWSNTSTCHQIYVMQGGTVLGGVNR